MRTLRTPATGSGKGNFACAERSGTAGGRSERLWGPDRRAATLGVGGSGARDPRHCSCCPPLPV